jgi:hypothetical protein
MTKYERYNYINDAECGISGNVNLKFVVSITSYLKRINQTYLSIDSILRQTFKPDVICLYLPKIEFPNGILDLPMELRMQMSKGLIIKFCENNYRVHNKIIHALKEYPNSVIINFDDDVYYNPRILKTLCDGHNEYPDDILTLYSNHVMIENNVRVIYRDLYDVWLKILTPEKNIVIDYSKFVFEYDVKFSHYPITCVGGTLYPPNSFNVEIFNIKKMLELTPHSLEVWLWAMATLNNTMSRTLSFNGILCCLHNDSTTPLHLYNCVIGEHNMTNRDRQLNRVINEYNINEIFYPNIPKCSKDKLELPERNI